MERIDEARLLAHVEALASLGSRYPGTPGNERAESYITNALEALQVDVVPSPQGGCGRYLSAHFAGRGADILLGAHFDSIANRTPGWRPLADPAPGANDNGTGVAGLLEIARVLADEDGAGRLRRPVTLLFFDCEETGMQASRRYVEQDRRGGSLLLNLDMVGFSAPGRTKLDLMRYPNSGDLPALVKAANERYGLGLQLVERPFPIDFQRAWVDSTPFAAAGIPAVTLTESYGQPGIDYPGYPDFHRVSDLPAAINNVAQWRAATQLVLAVALELAR